MFLKIQKRSLAFLLALILVLSTFVSVAVIPASAAEADVAATGDWYEAKYLDVGDSSVLVEVDCENNLSGFPNSYSQIVDENSYQIHVTGCKAEGGGMASPGYVYIYVTNNKDRAILFNYELLDITGVGDGSLLNGQGSYYEIIPSGEFEGDRYDQKGSFTYYLEPGEDISFSLCAQDNGFFSALEDESWDGVYIDFKLSGFREVVDGTATVSNDDNATIVANGTTLSDAEEDIAYTAQGGLTVQATPDAGFGFLAWVDENGNELSADNPATLFFDEDEVSVTPVIYENAGTTGNYGVKVPGYTNEAVFDSLADALDYEDGTAGRVITVLQNVTYNDDLAIPSGTTLLIPFDDAHTVYREEPEIVNDYTTPSAYAVMTMQSGSSLTVEDGGAICVGGQLCAKGQLNGWNGAPTGPDGRICMQGNSTITVENGGNLYAWGYIYRNAANDEGSVIAESGATVYEPFQIKNYRGGTVTLAIADSTFPFNQYYIQNIEVPLTVNTGAKEIGLGAVTAGGLTASCAVTFIGEGGMFVLENGYLIKDYIEAEDRLDIQIYGDSQLSSMSVTLYGNTLDTSNYPLPITNNISVELKEGALSINQDVSMLPGSELVIDEGASMTVEPETNVYVYDADQWNGQGYVGSTSTNFIPVGYSAANGTTKVRTNADIVDAQVDINGDVVVNGGFYCTDTGNVSSSQQTGTITYATNASTSASIEECSNNAQETSTVNFGVAQLKKPDGTFESPVVTDPETGATYFVTGEYAYENEDLSFDQMYYVTWLDYDGDESTPLYVQSFKTGETPVYGGATPTHANSEEYVFGSFTGWATEARSTTPVYNNNNLPAVGEADVIYYATYVVTEKVYTVKWNDKDGNELYTQSDVAVSAIDPSIHEAPEIPATYSGNYISTSTAYAMTEYQENYKGKALKTVSTFEEWSADYVYDDTTNEGVCTLTPLYNDVVQQLVLFVDGTGTDAHILDAQYYAIGAKIKPCEVYSGATPTKASDETYSYTYSGWQSSYSDNSTWTYALDDPDKQFTVTDLTKSGSTGKNNANKNTLVATFTQAEIPEESGKHSLTLNGEIDVNFYADLPDGCDASNTTADFSWGDKYIGPNNYDASTPNTLNGVQGKAADEGLVKFSLPVAVKELNDEITVTYKRDGEVVATETYRGTDYAYKILTSTDAELAPLLTGNQTAAQLKELVRVMLINSANAQTYFNYNTEQLATYRFSELGISYELNDVEIPESKIKYPTQDAFSDIKYYGSALNLEDELGYTLYFNINDPSSYSVDKYHDVSATTTDINGNTKNLKFDETFGVQRVTGGKKLRIKMDGLAAAEITNDIQLTYKGTTVTVNACDYLDLALTNGSAALQPVIQSLYNYNQAAIAFFGGNNG